MRIRAKISVLTTLLIGLVVVSIVINLLVMERRRAQAETASRMDTLMEGVLRIARESVNAHDELMLLSYLKLLMQEHPEISLAVAGREGYSSVMGEVRGELLYRMVTVAEAEAASFVRARPGAGRDAPAPRPAAKRAPGQALPTTTISVQLGFSRNALDDEIRRNVLALAGRIGLIAAAGLVLGAAGSFWLGRLLASPVLALADAAERLGGGQLDARVEVRANDEIGDLAGQFNRMGTRIEELVQFKEDLLGTLSHEMRTPLLGLKGFLEYLRESPAARDPKERDEAYLTMLDAVSQMDLSFTNALQLFRTGARRVASPESLDLREMAAEVIRLFAPAAQSSEVRLVGPSKGSPIRLSADRELIRRVIVNLVSNAILYTGPRGTVTVRLAESEEAASISVSDNGPGVAEADRERIFEKFYRAPGPDGRPRRIPGSGLGLAIAKQSVDLHQGRIWVESELGKGSVFHVWLPKRRVPA